MLPQTVQSTEDPVTIVHVVVIMFGVVLVLTNEFTARKLINHLRDTFLSRV